MSPDDQQTVAFAVGSSLVRDVVRVVEELAPNAAPRDKTNMVINGIKYGAVFFFCSCENTSMPKPAEHIARQFTRELLADVPHLRRIWSAFQDAKAKAGPEPPRLAIEDMTELMQRWTAEGRDATDVARTLGMALGYFLVTAPDDTRPALEALALHELNAAIVQAAQAASEPAGHA